jgi:uncharacterized protein YxeA
MKKILIAVLSVSLISVIFYSCSLLNALDEVQKNGFVCTNYSTAPVNEMDKTQVLEMIRNYHNNQYNAINASSFGFNGNIPSTISIKKDSRAAFFNIDTLKRLIYYIEKASEKFSPANRQNLGINIYFASYTALTQMQKHGYDYTNRHTLIFIPSIFDNSTKTARDFDLKHSLSGINVIDPKYIDSAFLNNPGITSIFGLMPLGDPIVGSNNMSSQNHGTLIPPPPTPTGNVILELTDPY